MTATGSPRSGLKPSPIEAAGAVLDVQGPRSRCEELALCKSYDILYRMSITATEARARLFPLIEEVNADQKAIEIISKRGTAYLVPADEYESWQETMYLLSSPANAERLRQSIAHARASELEEHELIEP